MIMNLALLRKLDRLNMPILNYLWVESLDSSYNTVSARKVFHVSLLYQAISGYENTTNKCYFGEQTILVTKVSTFDFVSMKHKRSLKGPQRLNF